MSAVNRPEAELLLLCARSRKDPGRAAQIRALLRRDIDWPYLLQIAHENRMGQLLFWHLDTTCPEAVPKVALDGLRSRFHKNAYRNLLRTGELLKLLKLFEAYGIRPIPYKGPTLAASLYGNLALREFDDLDILVPEQDVLKAKELLVSVGYQPEHELSRAQEVAFLKYHGEQSFTRDDDKSTVDLQWRITEKFRSLPIDFEGLWGRLEPLSLHGDTVLTLPPEDLLPILCMHGSKHFWTRLAWICDIAELIRVHEGINWEQVIERAGTLGSKRMLFLGLYLASDLLEAPLPTNVLHKVRVDPTVKALAEQVRERPFNEPNRQLKAFEDFRYQIRLRERLGDKIRYLVLLVLIPHQADVMFLEVPALLRRVYYVLRPVRLAVKYGRRLLGTSR